MLTANDIYFYRGLTKKDKNNRKYAIRYKPVPSDDDYNTGYINRYFCKSRTDDAGNTIIEIDKDQFDSYKNGELNVDYYLAISLQWKITGQLNNVFNSNGELIQKGVENANFDTIQLYEVEFSGLMNYLYNLTEFYKPNHVSSKERITQEHVE